MAVSDSVDPGTWFAEQIGACEPDLLRQMVKTMAEALMSAEADARRSSRRAPGCWPTHWPHRRTSRAWTAGPCTGCGTPP